MTGPVTTTSTGTRGRVVVGVDGSVPSVEALRWAARVAPALDADIEALMVWNYPAMYGLAPLPNWSPESDAEKIVRTAIDTAFGADPPAGLTVRVVEGTATQVLVDLSKAIDLLVLGSRGLGGFKGMLLGSVSTACAEHARCPVAVIHGSGVHPPSGAGRAEALSRAAS